MPEAYEKFKCISTVESFEERGESSLQAIANEDLKERLEEDAQERDTPHNNHRDVCGHFHRLCVVKEVQRTAMVTLPVVALGAKGPRVGMCA